MTKAEEEFVNQMARKMLVDWCLFYLQHGTLPTDLMPENVFVAHAIEKGWVSASLLKVLSTGFNTAAAFLRR